MASHERTKSVPPSHLPDVKTPQFHWGLGWGGRDTGTSLMSHVGAQSQPMSRGMWWGGWSDMRAMGSREEVSRVSHGHTPLPPPTCLANDNLITTTDFKPDKLKTKQDTLSKTQGREVCFQWLLWRETTKLGEHLCRPVFVRTVFLDSINTNCRHGVGRYPPPLLLALCMLGLSFLDPSTNGKQNHRTAA